MTASPPESAMEDAIVWFDDLRGSPAPDRHAFAEWLMRSPTHIEAFLLVSALHGGLSAACREDGDWLESLLDEARSNVVPFALEQKAAPLSAGTTVLDGEPPNRKWWWIRLAAAAVVLVTVSLVIGLAPLGGREGPQRYTTTLGEQRAIVLDDGSVMELNTDSAVSVRFTPNAREVQLTRGEAMFDVRKDAARPFRVRSGAVTVEAIGTRFNVYRHTEGMRVTVIEGRVSVESAGAAGGGQSLPQNRDYPTASSPVRIGAGAVPVELGPSEELTIRPDGEVARIAQIVDTERTTAWMQRRVVFDNDRLDTVVAEFNRYNRIKLLIADPLLRDRRISGIFTVDKPEVLAEVLASMTAVRTIEHTDGSLEIVPADPAADTAELEQLQIQ